MPELGLIPTLATGEDVYTAATSKLAANVPISLEAIDDASFPVVQQLTQTLQDTFSAKLDRDMIGGTGPAPVPTGILAVASEVTGADLELAAIAAKAEIATAGGTASHVAVSPTALGEVESARDDIGRALYPDAASQFAGLTTVVAPAASQPIVYDRSRLWLVVRRDFAADISREVSEAWNRYGAMLRIVGRFALAAPMPNRSVRKLTVTAGGAARTAPTKAPAKKTAA